MGVIQNALLSNVNTISNAITAGKALKEEEHDYGIMRRLLVQFDAEGHIRHNPAAVAASVEEILQKMETGCDLRVLFQ